MPTTTISKRRLAGRWLIAASAVAGLLLISSAGWYWQEQVICKGIAITGAHQADRNDLLVLAAVDSGATLYAIDPVEVGARLERHPWVRSARVRRLPTGTLSIHVAERIPVLLSLERNGRTSHYVDADGFRMPVPAGAVYDVPVLRGLEMPYVEGEPLEDGRLLELLSALSRADAATEALISEIALQPDGEVRLYTNVIDSGGAIPVRLGTSGFEEKLQRLSAFWEQAVLTRGTDQYKLIDLRFEGQIVTR